MIKWDWYKEYKKCPKRQVMVARALKLNDVRAAQENISHIIKEWGWLPTRAVDHVCQGNSRLDLGNDTLIIHEVKEK